MHQTAKVLYRPPGRTDDILLYHIEDFAGLAKNSRREIDRMIAEGEIQKVKWRGVTLVPAEFLSRFPSIEETDREQPERGQQQAGGIASGAEAKTEHITKAASATPWEELTYEAL